MNRPQKVEISKNLRLTSILSTSITGIVSVTYTILCILGLVYRYQCDTGDIQSISGADYFMNLFYKVYIQKDDCEGAQVWPNLTQSQSVYVLNIVTLCFSVVCCVAAILFMAAVLSGETSQFHQQLNLFAYMYIAVCVASQVVDLTYATHFGMDYTYLTDQLNLSTPGLGMNYEIDLLRLGAFVLMTISLKGFVGNAINCVLLILIIIYLIEYNKQIQKQEHSIHKLGALNAYDSQPRRMDPWQPEPQMMYRGPQVNPAYIEDNASMASHNQRREPNRTDNYRSDSWKNPGTGVARPFSYLEEPKRSPGPAMTRAPHEPTPDYSPHTSRRLKPALKPYM